MWELAMQRELEFWNGIFFLVLEEEIERLRRYVGQAGRSMGVKSIFIFEKFPNQKAKRKATPPRPRLAVSTSDHGSSRLARFLSRGDLSDG